MLGEFLLQILVEGLIEALGQGLLELGWLAARKSIAREREAPAILAWLGLFLIGAGLGGCSVYVWPHRLTAAGPFPGASLVVSPLLNGLAMDTFGRWRARRGRPRTHASTFWGGVAFALGFAVVRFWLVPMFPDLPVER